MRVLQSSVVRNEPFAVSAITLLEIALLAEKKDRLSANARALLGALEAAPEFLVVPLTFEVANEIASLGPGLRDPSDRTIVATARVHRLRLVTSDQRIISSKLVQTVE